MSKTELRCNKRQKMKGEEFRLMKNKDKRKNENFMEGLGGGGE